MTTVTNDAMQNKIVYVPARTTQGYWFAGGLFNFLVSGEESGGSYTTMEVLVLPGTGPGLHVHDNEEEQFYVLEGELTYWVGNQTIHMSAGDFLHIPRDTARFYEWRDAGKAVGNLLPCWDREASEAMGERVNDQAVDPWLRG